jgi:activator of 2-hydroxyglutaryl-CoA dehydratase
MIIADIGTSYAKILDIGSGKRYIVPSLKLGKMRVDVACGHNANLYARHYVNELIALSKGALQLIRDDDFICVDIGSRDIKYVEFRKREFVGASWNYQCGAMAGFTIEMLARSIGVNYDKIQPVKEAIPFTCGVLGISAVFDLIAKGIDKEVAVAMLLKGITNSIVAFTKKPKKLYLSGGMCDNPLFISSFDIEVVPLGRWVLVEGLVSIAKEKYYFDHSQ